MELTQLTTKFKELLKIEDVIEAPQKIMEILFSCSSDVLEEWHTFCPDLSSDSLQPIFQYYMADRKEKKQDYTPKTLAKAICVLADVQNAHTVYDMCAGSGALTIQAWNINPECHFICQEFDKHVIPFLLFNLMLRNVNATVIHGDVLGEEQFKAYIIRHSEKFSTVAEVPVPIEIKADVCISNPPYNMKWDPPVFASINERFKYGVPPKSNANYAFISAAVQVAERAVLLLPNGVLLPDSLDEKEIIRNLIAHNLIDCIAVCPDKMFEATTIGTCLYSINKTKQTATVEMVDMRQIFVEEERLQNGQYGDSSHTNRTYSKTVKTFSDENIEKLIAAVEMRTNEPEFSAAVTSEDMAEKDFSLVPSRYIEFVERVSKHREYSAIINDINKIIKERNSCKIVINETLAHALKMDVEAYKKSQNNYPDNDFIEKISGQKILKDDYITFTKNKGEFVIKSNDPEHLNSIFKTVLTMWKQHNMYLNEQENIYLAELRDALIPELLSGNIEV